LNFQDSSQLSNKIAVVPVSPIPSIYSSQSPLTFIRSTPDVNIEVFTPENNSWIPFPVVKPSKKYCKSSRKLFSSQSSCSPVTPW